MEPMTTVDRADPVTSDPASVDPDYPPTLATILLDSGGATMHGLLYVANGPGPHPTAILLHGYPGDEKNLDLAQAIRRCGWNALVFHYRGSWGSGGAYSVEHAVEDVLAAIDFCYQPGTQRSYRVDPERVALVGHSMGAYVGLIAASQRPSIGSICFMAGINLSQSFVYPEYREAAVSYLDALGHGAVVGVKWADESTKIVANLARYDLLQLVPALDGRRLLFIAATEDDNANQNELVEQIKSRTHADVTTAEFADDHVFSSHRIALARLITGWLK